MDLTDREVRALANHLLIEQTKKNADNMCWNDQLDLLAAAITDWQEEYAAHREKKKRG